MRPAGPSGITHRASASDHYGIEPALRPSGSRQLPAYQSPPPGQTAPKSGRSFDVSGTTAIGTVPTVRNRSRSNGKPPFPPPIGLRQVCGQIAPIADDILRILKAAVHLPTDWMIIDHGRRWCRTRRAIGVADHSARAATGTMMKRSWICDWPGRSSGAFKPICSSRMLCTGSSSGCSSGCAGASCG